MVMGPINSGVNAAKSALGLRFDTSPAWKFYVEVLGVIVGEFMECSGLGMEREVKRVREGGTNDFEWLVPGGVTYSNITLKHGITYSRELWSWFQTGSLDGQVLGLNTVPGGKMAIKALKSRGIHLPHGTNISIILGTVEGKKAKHWDITGAIPVKWTGPELNSGSDSLAVETLEFAHHGLNLSYEIMTPMAGWF
jgi:phage tail-like protein